MLLHLLILWSISLLEMKWVKVKKIAINSHLVILMATGNESEVPLANYYSTLAPIPFHLLNIR